MTTTPPERPAAASTAPAGTPLARSPHAVLAVTSLALALVLINGTSITVALPALSRDFGAPAGLADWFLLAFLLATTASILVFGRISDLVGRRRIYLAGMTAFMVLSVLATIAPDAGTFIAVRALQGVAAATIVANTSALVADAFPEHRLAYGLSLNLTAASVANTVGPTIGGLLVSAAGWQAVFLVNVPFGLAALLLGLRVLPAPRPRPGPRETFDATGAVLSAAALAALLYGVNRLSTAGPADLGVWALLTAGVLLLVSFGLLERKLEHPLVDLALIRDKGRACAYGAAFFQSFGRAGVTVLVVLQQQIVAGRSAAEAGFTGMAMALALVVATPVSGRLAAVLTARTMTAIGGILSVVGLVGLALSPATAPLPLTMGWLVLVGAGIGTFTTPNTAAIMRGVPAARRTVANAVRSMLYNSAAALGTSVVLLVVSASGIAGYDVDDAGPAVRAAFTVALLVCAAAEAVAFGFGVARGGPWRVRPRARSGRCPASGERRHERSGRNARRTGQRGGLRRDGGDAGDHRAAGGAAGGKAGTDRMTEGSEMGLGTVLVTDELQLRALGAPPAGWRHALWEELEAGAVPDADVRFVAIDRRGGAARRHRMRELPGVERVQVLSVGYDYVAEFVPAGARAHNAASVIAETTAEQGLLGILAALRRLPDYVRAQDRGDWVDVNDPTSAIPASALESLVGATVVQLGHGVVGKALARRLEACGADVVPFARTARVEAGRQVRSLDELDGWLPRADVVSSALPLGPETRRIVDAAFLARLRDGALFSNVGRGATVDTGALTAELATGRIRASLDVVDPEPLSADHPLWRMPNVLLTPHMAGDARTTARDLAALVAAQVEAYRTGHPLIDDVTDHLLRRAEHVS